MYIGIRADEFYRIESSKKNKVENIIEKHPFINFGIIKKDVENILKNAGIGIPDYYKWRKRSGCYFCFFQSPNDWLNLYKYHPDLYKKAMEYEFETGDDLKKSRFGWNTKYSLKELIENKNTICSDIKTDSQKELYRNLIELL